MARTFLLAGGGTAGHVNPLIATGLALVARGHRVVALGTDEGLEADLVPRAGLELRTIARVPLPRRPGTGWLTFPSRLGRVLRETRSILDELNPDAVVGFGGYVSAPLYLAARKRGIPSVVHEANALPGIANRLGARWAKAVAVVSADVPLRGAVVTGIPLRADIERLATARRVVRSTKRAQARGRLGWPDDAKAVLIMGGSLGAARINAALAGTIERLAGHGIYAIHLAGRGKADESERARGDLPAKLRAYYVVREYEHDMAAIFSAVDAVVCRSGAGTVAEVTALGLPALYIPLPIGNGEQALNAAPAVAAGAADVLENDRVTASSLALAVEGILLEPERAASMAAAAKEIGVADGAARLVDLIEGIVP